MWSVEKFEAARSLIGAGVNDCAISGQIGVPRLTVRDWRCRPPDQKTTALDDLRIPWTRPSKYQVAVYRKAATARLDDFVGPKC